MKGEVAYLYVYDTGAELNLDKIERVLDRRAQVMKLAYARAVPRYIDLPKPLTVKFSPVMFETIKGPTRFDVSAKIFSVGAISISIRTEVSCKFEDLASYDNMYVRLNGDDVPLSDYANDLYKKISESIKEAREQNYGPSSEPMLHTVFCITETEVPVSDLMGSRKKELAAFLEKTDSPEKLSDNEVSDILRYWYSYYGDDLIVVEWERAFVVEPSGKYEDVLFIIETSNMQLVELIAYDDYLDKVLDKAYDDMGKVFSRRGILYSARATMRELSEIRIDLTEITEELANITKFFGDWYLAKIYMSCSKKLHIDDWYKTVQDKLETLSKLYAMANDENDSRRMFMLELIVTLMFVIDIVVLLFIELR
jgi:hypothetical protein